MHHIVPVLVLTLVSLLLSGCLARPSTDPGAPGRAGGAGLGAGGLRGAGPGPGGVEDCRTHGRIAHLDDLILLPTGHNHPDLVPPEPMSPARVCFYR